MVPVFVTLLRTLASFCCCLPASANGDQPWSVASPFLRKIGVVFDFTGSGSSP